MISIIVPIFNGERYLERCLDSVLIQSFFDFELILVNDGSKDSSLEICRNYAKKDARIQVFTQENHGVSAARNFAMEKVRGEYVTFVDCDDWLDSDYLQILYDNLVQKEVDLSIVGYREIGQDGIVIRDTGGIAFRGLMEREEMLKRLFVPVEYMSFCYPWGKLYKSSIIFENDLRFDESVAIGEDRLFTFHYVLNAEKSYATCFSCYNYWINPSGAMSLLQQEAISLKYISNFGALAKMREVLKEKDKGGDTLSLLNQDFVRSLVSICRIVQKKSRAANKVFLSELKGHTDYYLWRPSDVGFRLWIKLVLDCIKCRIA